MDDNIEFLEYEAFQIRNYLKTRLPDFEMQTFTESDRLLDYARQETIDLLFSDIDLEQQDRNGVETVRALQQMQPNCAVVYLTNYLNFATEVYETPHIYFVLKSELCRRLPAVFERFRREKPVLITSRLYLGRRRGTQMVDANQILYCEHQGRVTKVVLGNKDGAQSEVTTYRKLTELMAQLDEQEFLRCHLSYIVHLRYVAQVRRSSFTMTDGTEIPISRTRSEAVRRRFTEYLEQNAKAEK